MSPLQAAPPTTGFILETLPCPPWEPPEFHGLLKLCALKLPTPPTMGVPPSGPNMCVWTPPCLKEDAPSLGVPMPFCELEPPRRRQGPGFPARHREGDFSRIPRLRRIVGAGAPVTDSL